MLDLTKPISLDPVKIQSKFIKWSALHCYQVPDTEGNNQNFYTIETLTEFLGEQGWWYSGKVAFNIILFQRFEPKQVFIPPFC